MAPKHSADTAGVDKAKRKRSSLPTQQKMMSPTPQRRLAVWLATTTISGSNPVWCNNYIFRQLHQRQERTNAANPPDAAALLIHKESFP
ncbi:hypothetical protein E2C01_030092 [Portunus trituberculatus]|uniref:Uncharacterized protein n=1 Tax=Portunus trituberculatus TaxID=210409 RepID=A0A5B7ETU4_PORTR|nr:hypothetical protein [Portunus trituberculatus]